MSLPHERRSIWLISKAKTNGHEVKVGAQSSADSELNREAQQLKGFFKLQAHILHQGVLVN